MKRVLIIHGFAGYPGKNWFPWLAAEVEKLGITALVPQMPNADKPKLSEWLAHLNSILGKADEDLYIVAHSLGCITTLRYIEALPEKTKIGGVIIVGGFASPINRPELDNYFATPMDDKKIKRGVRKIVAINSSNDPHFGWEKAEEIRDRFGAELIGIENAGHLDHKVGYLSFPLVLEKLKELMGA